MTCPLPASRARRRFVPPPPRNGPCPEPNRMSVRWVNPGGGTFGRNAAGHFYLCSCVPCPPGTPDAPPAPAAPLDTIEGLPMSSVTGSEGTVREPRHVQPWSSPAMAPSRAEPIEILLVEDSPDDADLTMDALRDGRVRNRVTVVDDGVKAMAYLRREGKYGSAPRPD